MPTIAKKNVFRPFADFSYRVNFFIFYYCYKFPSDKAFVAFHELRNIMCLCLCNDFITFLF